jgi:hypothetical protein
VVSPGRIFVFICALVALIAGLGSGMAWVNGHASPIVVGLIGALLCFWGLGVVALLTGVGERLGTVGTTWALLPLGVALFFGVTFVADKGAVGYALGYLYIAAAAIPLFWWAYRSDKANHKPCPDCCERIKGDARICRYCGYEFWRPAVGAPDLVSDPSRPR